MTHILADLPYPKHALAPHISEETLEYHYGKHHQSYVTTLNALIPGTEFEDLPLEAIIKKASGPIFNNAAQVWNHSFFWNCLTPQGAPSPGARWAMQFSVNGARMTALKRRSQNWRSALLALAGPGWSGRRTVRLIWRQPSMRARRLPLRPSRCSRSMYGSMPITSITATRARNSLKHSGIL